MKELSIEQKAKAYDEALERAREFVSKDNVEVSEYIFPELAEYKDERIRKGIKSVLEHYKESGEIVCPYPFVSIDDALAWLETQGKNKSIDDLTQQEAMDIAVAKCFNEQKSTDKVESKFKIGDWITDGQLTCKVLAITGKSYELHLHNDDYCHFETDVQSIDKHYHLWGIEDAKDGDVLASNDGLSILIFRNLDTSTSFSSYYNIEGKGELGWSNNVFIPATKEQRNQLEKAMADAGYTFDFKKKELKKTNEEFNGEDYGIDSLFHAQRILEKSLGKVDGYQSDDGILDHKCAITAVKKLYKQKPIEWHREDEHNLNACLGYIPDEFLRRWLKDVIPVKYDKSDWSEEDVRSIRDSIFYLKSAKKYFEKDDDIVWDEKWFRSCIKWLESLYKRLQPQNTWKPSDEQVVAFEDFVRSIGESGYVSPYDNNTKLLYSLLNNLRKLREE